ncbi:hypothetical protein BD324DRAFT_71992 [Kockovaella imperatae]|uniref:HMG box domain-containing protein n=1 Tax=Kockovaella imperatae TaxID=4999 RepID=A0A1Y1UDS8_9TREE|nr:hypothetical protein BD324DRAFT_71992 [Kockovaella imperatae]ORX35697.1 hypothetical protein BD324DRAFT_71992 [Kockovaella imperatae]
MLHLVRATRLQATVGASLLNNSARAFSSSALSLKYTKSQREELELHGLQPPPKAPTLPYGAFVRDFYANGSGGDKVPVTQASAEIKEAWGKLSAAEKSKYQEEYKQARQRYQQEFETYMASLSKKDLNNVEKIIGRIRMPGGRQAATNKDGEPRKVSGYIKFSQDLRSSGKIDIEQWTGRDRVIEFAKEAGRQWKALDQSERDSWNQRAKGE